MPLPPVAEDGCKDGCCRQQSGNQQRTAQGQQGSQQQTDKGQQGQQQDGTQRQ